MANLSSAVQYVLLDRLLGSSDVSIGGGQETGLGLMALSIFLVCLGLGFLAYAAYISLEANYNTQIAAAAIGGFSLLLALLIGLGSLGVLYYKRLRLKKIRQHVAQTFETALDVIEEEFGAPIRDNPKTAILLATLSGFVTGEKIL